MSIEADQKEIVRTGYDALSHLYRGDAETPTNHARWISLLVPLLPAPSARVLDLGCGCGVPVSRDLATAGYDVTGVDISAVQIERARKLVPTGKFIQGDISTPRLLEDVLEVEPGTQFAAIVALYVLIHVPVAEQPALIHRLGEWVEDGGWCIMTTGATEWTGEMRGWLGSDESVRMWWSHASADVYRRWMKDAGFDIVRDEHVPEEGSDGHQFFLLRKNRQA